MGASPSTTINSTVPTYPKIWKNKTAPTFRVYGIKDQVSAYGTYNPECSHCNNQGCYAGECTAFTNWEQCGEKGAAQMHDATGTLYTPTGKDYTSYYEDCYCSTKPICSRVNIEECWLGNDVDGEEPTYRADWQGDRKLKCTYDLGKINTLSQIYAFRDKFKPDANDESYFQIMSNFANIQSKECFVDPTTQLQINTCSRITATSKDPNAQICKVWFEGLDAAHKNAFISQYCSENQQSVECKCELRAYNPVFQNVKKYFSDAVEDACIFVPCKGGSPAFLVNARDANPKCPTTLCQDVYNVTAGGSVVIQNNQNYLSCAPPAPPDEPDKPVIHPIPIEPMIPTPEPIISQPPNYRKIIGIAILVLLLILIIFLFL